MTKIMRRKKEDSRMIALAMFAIFGGGAIFFGGALILSLYF